MDNLEINELKKIVLGLKVVNFGNIDEQAHEFISELIKQLPSSEKIDTFTGVKDNVKKLTDFIGYIMDTIQTYTKSNKEYKIRNLSVKNLPPRYKTLDWSKASSLKSLMKVAEIVDKYEMDKAATFFHNASINYFDYVLGDEKQIVMSAKNINDGLGEMITRYAAFGDTVKNFFGGNNTKNNQQDHTQYYKDLKYINQAYSSVNGILQKLMQDKDLGSFYGDLTKVVSWLETATNSMGEGVAKELSKKYLSDITDKQTKIYEINSDLDKKISEFASLMKNSLDSIMKGGAPIKEQTEEQAKQPEQPEQAENIDAEFSGKLEEMINTLSKEDLGLLIQELEKMAFVEKHIIKKYSRLVLADISQVKSYITEIKNKYPDQWAKNKATIIDRAKSLLSNEKQDQPQSGNNNQITPEKLKNYLNNIPSAKADLRPIFIQEITKRGKNRDAGAEAKIKLADEAIVHFVEYCRQKNFDVDLVLGKGLRNAYIAYLASKPISAYTKEEAATLGYNSIARVILEKAIAKGGGGRV